jgi:transcriptional regulator with XRE-family HTH domain
VPLDRHRYLHRLLGLRLRRARENAGLTQREVEARLGYAQSMISNCEKAGRRVDAWELQQFARLYGTTVAELMKPVQPGEPTPPNAPTAEERSLLT